MSRVITHEEMESRKRIARIRSSISDAIFSARDENVTYEELLCAMTESLCFWAGQNWAEDFKDLEEQIRHGD